MAFNVELMPVSALKPYEKNAKKHPPEQVDRIAKSIKDFGFKQNIVIDKDNVVVIGHGRLLAAKKLGIDKVPCIRADDLSEEQIKALRLADNKVAESDWDFDLLNLELEEIDIDMSGFGFDIDVEDDDEDDAEDFDFDDNLKKSLRHNVFENQERMQFPWDNYYGIPSMRATQTHGSKFLRFCDHNQVEDLSEYIAHFYYHDFAFIQAWRNPDKYVDDLKRFKAVISPDFSLYTDFPRALQILSCYRRQWCGAYWQSLGIDVIPDVVWGDEESFEYCFDGIPERSVVATSSVGVANDEEWNGREGEMFKAGYNEMLNQLKPTKIIFYGTLPDGLDGDIIRVPSFYEEKRDMLNERKAVKEKLYGKRKQWSE